MRYLFTLIIISVAYLSVSAQKFQDLAETPPMGWNSWNTFATEINEELIKQIADKIVNTGLKDAGYEYIILDDGWMAMHRDENGDLLAHPERFPSGMKALGDYIHSKGLKFGLYNCAGDKTCAGYPGSRGHEYQDALKYAQWGVDYLKYDWCNTDKLNAEGAYMTMRDALYNAGRPIVFSICEWGDNEPWKWGKNIGHLWRISGDITNCWNCEVNHGSWSSWGILKIVDMHKDKRLRKHAGSGHWNDFDMMEVGNDLSQAEDRAHFALWCMNASPLILGNDLRSMSESTLDVLINKDMIAINQDSLGVQGFSYYNEGNLDVWIKPLKDEGWAFCFLNRGDMELDVNFDWESQEAVQDDITGRYWVPSKEPYDVFSVFDKKPIGSTKTTFVTSIKAHDVVVLKLSK